jgi:hypothetical protein
MIFRTTLAITASRTQSLVESSRVGWSNGRSITTREDEKNRRLLSNSPNFALPNTTDFPVMRASRKRNMKGSCVGNYGSARRRSCNPDMESGPLGLNGLKRLGQVLFPSEQRQAGPVTTDRGCFPRILSAAQLERRGTSRFTSTIKAAQNATVPVSPTWFFRRVPTSRP